MIKKMTREEAILHMILRREELKYSVSDLAEDIKAFDMAIEALEQEPKTGHWIDNMDLGYHVSICSNCNWRGHGDVNLIYKSKYCPNCGAKMEGR